VALVRPIEAGDHAKQRRLAGPVRADEPDPIAVSENERNARKERKGVVRPDQAVAFQHGPSYLSRPILALWGGGRRECGGPALVASRQVV